MSLLHTLKHRLFRLPLRSARSRRRRSLSIEALEQRIVLSAVVGAPEAGLQPVDQTPQGFAISDLGAHADGHPDSSGYTGLEFTGVDYTGLEFESGDTSTWHSSTSDSQQVSADPALEGLVSHPGDGEHITINSGGGEDTVHADDSDPNRLKGFADSPLGFRTLAPQSTDSTNEGAGGQEGAESSEDSNTAEDGRTLRGFASSPMGTLLAPPVNQGLSSSPLG